MDKNADTIDFGENTKEEKAAQIAKDKAAYSSISSQSDKLAQGLQSMKDWDKIYEDNQLGEKFKNLKYADREEDAELKQAYEVEQGKLDSLSSRLAGKIDGEINLDLHGNLTFRDKPGEKPKDGITGTGTYVLRDGKLVEGKGMVREQASFSNWYCSNADPEDLRKHRELMDRMNYKGPQWEG